MLSNIYLVKTKLIKDKIVSSKIISTHFERHTEKKDYFSRELHLLWKKPCQSVLFRIALLYFQALSQNNLTMYQHMN